MSKKRVYEIAKQLDKGAKEIIEILKGFDVEVKNHMSSVDEKSQQKLLAHFKKESDNKEPNKNKENQKNIPNKNPEIKKEVLVDKKTENVNSDKKPEQKIIEKKNMSNTQGNNNQQRTNNNQGNNNQQRNNNQGNNNQQRNSNQGNNNQQRNNNQGNNNQQRNNNQGNNNQQRNNNNQGNNNQRNNNNQGNNNQRNNNNQGNNQRNNQQRNNQQRNNYQGNNQQRNNNYQGKNNKGNQQGKNANKNNAPKKEVAPQPPVEKEVRIIQIPESITIKDLADRTKISTANIIKKLMSLNVLATINQEIDFDTASLLAEEFNIILEIEQVLESEDIMKLAFSAEEEDKEEDLSERPPVVVVMGHVDHGKTSLLDRIRKTKVVAKEAGGITQHIGAYMVPINGKKITFLDTPGHEAFTAMRMRGAQVTDIAILVVAADDGVMPQTVEAINHAKAAGIEIIVAINKIDKEGANPERVKQELTEHGLVVEEWGGEIICVPVSAISGEGIDTLLEMIILSSEMKELKANPNKMARGTIVEALLDKGRGTVATVLVQEGTLRVGDPIVAGECHGKVRAMMSYNGKRLKKAGPSTPVEILGLSDVPTAGDSFYVAENERKARQVAETIFEKGRIDMLKGNQQKVSLEDLFDQIKAGEVKDLNIIVKADVQGSVEAVRTSLEKLTTDEVRVRTIHGGVGAITESDVMLASASSAIIIGFNVRPEATAKSIAEEAEIDIRLYRVIYTAIDDIKQAMKGLLDPIFKEKIVGHADIRETFKASGVGTIGGGYVTDGTIIRSNKVRILRDNIVVYEGELSTLKRFKDDAREVNTGYECGMLFSKFNDIKVGDVVESYTMEEIPRELK